MITESFPPDVNGVANSVVRAAERRTRAVVGDGLVAHYRAVGGLVERGRARRAGAGESTAHPA